MRDARGAAKAVQLLDLLEEFFDGGKRWTRGDLWDGHGRRCIRGAMEYLRRRHDIRWDPTTYYLLQAIPGGWPLISFNDVVCRDYAPMLAVIRKARALAVAELEEQQLSPLRQAA
jgi:hypothetical protein